jgi:Fe-S-cluster containining protein
MAAMAEFLGLSPAEFECGYVWDKYETRSLRELENLDCVFLESDEGGGARCALYSVRPLQCRTFPFWPSLLGDKSVWDRYASSCPGMNNGEFHSYCDICEILRRSRFL